MSLTYLLYSIACDIVEGRLESARLVGADVVVNCAKENLEEISMCQFATKSICGYIITVSLVLPARRTIQQ